MVKRSVEGMRNEVDKTQCSCFSSIELFLLSHSLGGLAGTYHAALHDCRWNIKALIILQSSSDSVRVLLMGGQWLLCCVWLEKVSNCYVPGHLEEGLMVHAGSLYCTQRLLPTNTVLDCTVPMVH